jgi:alpha-L-fucosidase
MEWPFGGTHLPGLTGKLEYAQLLHDASEVKFRDNAPGLYGQSHGLPTKGCVSLELPVVKPNVDIPVVELFLK